MQAAGPAWVLGPEDRSNIETKIPNHAEIKSIEPIPTLGVLTCYASSQNRSRCSKQTPTWYNMFLLQRQRRVQETPFTPTLYSGGWSIDCAWLVGDTQGQGFLTDVRNRRTFKNLPESNPQRFRMLSLPTGPSQPAGGPAAATRARAVSGKIHLSLSLSLYIYIYTHTCTYIYIYMYIYTYIYHIKLYIILRCILCMPIYIYIYIYICTYIHIYIYTHIHTYTYTYMYTHTYTHTYIHTAARAGAAPGEIAILLAVSLAGIVSTGHI